MAFDPQSYVRRERQPERRSSGSSMSDDNKMGLILLVVAVLAIGGYTLLVFGGVFGGRAG